MNSYSHTGLGRHWFLLLFCFSQGSPAAGPEVVASIMPIHSLVAGIMQGVAEPRLLISGQQSPHNFSLKPSDMRVIRQAQLIVWVGPAIETSLSHILEKGDYNAQVLTLSDLQRLPLLPTREGGEWDAHNHLSTAHQHADEESDNLDSHLWLSPLIAQKIVQQVADALIRLDSAHADRYAENRQALLQRLQDLDEELSNRLSSVRGEPYIVFHDAYHYFEQRYQLNAVGSVSINAERMPGARRVHELREKISRLHARCIFAEPQFEPKLIQTLAEGSDAKTGQLDPLGSDLPAGPDAYFQLMRRLSQNLIECLK
jgi:zinc transport system substrate-binding protein